MILSITDTHIIINPRLGNGFLDIDIPDKKYFKTLQYYLEGSEFVSYVDKRNILHLSIGGNIKLELELCLIIIKAILLPEILNNKMKDLHNIKLKLDLSDDI